MKMRRWESLAALTLLATGTPPIHAQIAGVVHDDAGHAVVNAQVELWGDSARYDQALTDSAGRFVLDANTHARRALAFGLGTDSAYAPLGDLLHPLEIVLHARPLPLPGLTAATHSLTCPKRDDPRARALWTEVAATYVQLPDDVQWQAAIVKLRKGETRAGEFGSIPFAKNFRALTGSGHHSPPKLAADVPLSDGWIERHGYAQPLSMSSFDGTFEAWRYLRLDGAEAPHLISAEFARLQRFAFDPGSAPQSAISFCSKNTRRPWVRGRIVLNDDRRVTHLEWQFVTPKPVEEAGGQAEFLPHARYFLPSSGEYWRRTPVGLYYQEAKWYGPWIVRPFK